MQMRCKSYMCLICLWPVYGSLYVYGQYMGAYMYMASIWELICIWPVYGSLYVYGRYMGAIRFQWSILTTHLYPF